jgi:integrase
VNPERKTLYQLVLALGRSQGDIANLKGEDVDWTNGTVSFTRKKSGVPVLVHLGAEALNVFKDLPAEGVLFPYLSRVRAGDRATEFGQRCRQLGIKGVTLHSYRYAWAERAKTQRIPGTVRAGGFGAQQQGRASRLRETRPDENSVVGRLRTRLSTNLTARLVGLTDWQDWR